MRNTFVHTAALLAALAAPLTLRAQVATPIQPAPITPSQVISVNPLAAMLGFYTGDYERAVTSSTTLGVGASYWSTGISGANVSYLSTEAKVRYYPSDRALTGFALGGAVGWSHLSGELGNDRGSANAASLGVELSYNWLLGVKQNVAVGLGAGAKRLFLRDAGSNVDLSYPTVRLSVGLAF